MGKKHRLPERRQQILEAIEKAGQLSVVELSADFEVSEVTIWFFRGAGGDRGRRFDRRLSQ